MRRTLLLMSFLMFSYAGFSQINGNYNYTIALRGFSIIQMPKILDQSTSNNYINTYLNGVMVKFNDNQISYRLNGSYFKNTQNFSNICKNCERSNGDVTDYSFKIGFEKSFNYSRIQPYFAFDIGFRSNKYDGVTKDVNMLNAQNNTTNVNKDVEASKDGLTVSPVIGLKINPSKEISIFAESNLELFYFYERQETVAQDAENTTTLNKYHKSEFLLNPLSIGIQIHLGSKN